MGDGVGVELVGVHEPVDPRQGDVSLIGRLSNIELDNIQGVPSARGRRFGMFHHLARLLSHFCQNPV